MYKKLLFKILILSILLILLNIIYNKWFYEGDIQKHSEIINLVRNIPDSTDVIYMGESSNITFRSDDIDKRPISDFIGDYFPDLNFYHITKPASHAGIYKVLLEKIPNNNKVKTIIVTLNLRSFNAQWIYSNLETSLQKSIVLLKPYPPLFNRFLLSFKAFDIKTKKEREHEIRSKWLNDEFVLPFKFKFKNVIEWDNWMANTGIKDTEGNYDKAQTELACHYIKAYGFQIDTSNNPRIKDFNEIIEIAQNRKWNIVFNLMAENTEKANKLVGADLSYMINENAKILTEYFRKRGVLVVNNLNKVENKQFIDQSWTTEHYAEKGRKIIAKNVAEVLKKWYADYFDEVNYNETYQSEFFNDCDRNIIWGQMQSITQEVAYSGTKSSKTGDGNDFSITLEYPLKFIPDSLKNFILIESMILQTSINHNAKMVLEAKGKEFKYFWKGYALRKNRSELNKWINYQIEIEIPDSIKQADLCKIYLYNPSKERVYIDDFKISFVN